MRSKINKKNLAILSKAVDDTLKNALYNRPTQFQPTQLELNFDKQTYTRAEVIAMLEDVYMDTAGSHNDYGRRPSDYAHDAHYFVGEYMKER